MAKRTSYRRGPNEIVPEQAALGVARPEASTDRFLSPNEIGKILNVTGEAVKRWIFSRRLLAVKLRNGYWKVRVTDFEAFLKVRNLVEKRRVLVTDTPAKLMSDVVDIIEQLEYQPVVATSYADALLKSLERRPSLFIINLGIKEMAPWKLATRIRATKALCSVPILLMADTDLSTSEAEQALQISAHGFVKLPAENGALVKELKRIVNRLS